MGVLLAVSLAGTAACNGSEDSGMSVEERANEQAVEVRQQVDDLAALVGSNPQVRQDEIGACEPGDDEGLLLSYYVGVDVEPGSAERIRGEVAERYEAEGWTIRRDPPANGEVSTRFLKGTFSLGAHINEEVGKATVGGSGGCVR